MNNARACARRRGAPKNTLGENPSQTAYTIMDLESVFNSAVTGEKQGKSVWQAEVALRLSKNRGGGTSALARELVTHEIYMYVH